MKVLRTVLILLVAVALGVFGAQWLSHQNSYDLGNVVVSVGGNDYRAAMPQALLILVIALLVLWLVWTLISLPFRVWGKYRRKKGRARLIEGLRAADHGQWQRAERLLVTASEDDDVSGIALASAVRVADARGDDASATALAQQLAERDPTAHALLQGERHLARQRPVEAINALDSANAQPLPARGLLLRTQALAQIGRADEAYGQLGALRQQAVLPPMPTTRWKPPWPNRRCCRPAMPMPWPNAGKHFPSRCAPIRPWSAPTHSARRFCIGTMRPYTAWNRRWIRNGTNR